MDNNNKRPKIRFKGFTDDWKQCKLSTLFEKFDDGDWIEAKDQSSSGVRLVQTGNVGVTKFIDKPDNKKWVSEETFERLHCEEIFPGDILISRLPEPAGRACILPETGTRMITAVDCTIARATKENSADFIVQCLSTPGYFKWVNTCLAGGTRQRISRSMLADYDIMVPPTAAEQQVIGAYFKNLDHLITLHQHKLDLLNKSKSSLLDQVFPKEGEKAPRLRFKGFADDWEQRKLTDIATMHARIGWQNLRTSEFLDDGDYYLITGTDFQNGRIDFTNCHYVAKERYDQDRNIQIHNGSILITKDGTLGKVAYVNGLNKPATLNAGVFNVVIKSSDVDGKYLYQYLAGPFLMDYVSKRATGGTIKHLNQEILVDFPVELPSYEEQKKIGKTLQDLDTFITLHQHKLDLLKHIKESLLNSMFVS